MPHPQLEQHGSFEHLKLGRKRPAPDPRTLRLADYHDPAAIEFPPRADYGSAVSKWPMYGNHRLSDCTCAAVGHMIQAWSASAGAPKTPPYRAIVTLYWQTGDPSGSTGTARGPTDDGRDERTVLNYWRQNGVAGDGIVAYVSIDPAKLDHVRAALYLFGGVYAMLALPDSAKKQAEWDVVGDGKTGPAEPASWGDHAVPYVAYDADSFTCVTWGATQRLTNGFHSAYAQEAFAVVSNDFFSGPKARALDLEQLEADLRRVSGSRVPSPGPRQ